jgi:predicted phage tail protein
VSGSNLLAGTVFYSVWSLNIESLIPPATPLNLIITDSSSTTITIKWRKNTEGDFLRYRIYGGTTSAPTTKIDSTSGGLSDTSKTFIGLTNGMRYYFRVTAVDNTGYESAYSNEVSAVPADRLPPAAPADLVITDSSTATITIKWRKNSEPDFLRYRVYRGTSLNPTTKVDSTTGGAADTSKTFAGLTNGTRYYFRVTALDSAGNESAYSNEVNGAPHAAVGVEDLLSQIPKEYSLDQNYPNPFNPTTTIEYALPHEGPVRLALYDNLGRRVKVLVETIQSAGFYKVVLDAQGLSSGMYYYRIQSRPTDGARLNAVGGQGQAGDFVKTRKMLVVK